jgi:hypothetical protein
MDRSELVIAKTVSGKSEVNMRCCASKRIKFVSPRFAQIDKLVHVLDAAQALVIQLHFHHLEANK